MQNFSVIIPVYKLENPDFLLDAINSITNQSRAPDEIIIVIDGPIGDDLENVIKNFINQNKIIIIRLERSLGPGSARHAGILKSSFNIIALMDSDDISRTNRFEKELDILENESIDLVGGWIEEFIRIPGDLNKLRTTPENHEQIFIFGKWRMPVNHVTLMFKKEAYFSVGGYKGFRYAEDYDLITRMLAAGMKFHNIQKVLVDVRLGDEMFNRRGGLSFLKAELKVLTRMHSSGYLNIWQYVCNIIIRLLIRLLPRKILTYLYIILLRRGPNISSS